MKNEKSTERLTFSRERVSIYNLGDNYFSGASAISTNITEPSVHCRDVVHMNISTDEY